MHAQANCFLLRHAEEMKSVFSASERERSNIIQQRHTECLGAISATKTRLANEVRALGVQFQRDSRATQQSVQLDVRAALEAFSVTPARGSAPPSPMSFRREPLPGGVGCRKLPEMNGWGGV